MKKTIALIAFLAVSTKQYAQIEKGTYVPSISINAIYTSNPAKDSLSANKNNLWNSTVTLGFGKFIQDNLLLSGSLIYAHYYSKRDEVGNKNSYANNGSSFFGNNESIGAYLLKYKFLTENFAIRYGASLSIAYSETINRRYYYYQSGYNSLTGTYASNALENVFSYTNSLGATLNLLAGIQYFVSKNLALTGSMGFFGTTYSYSPYEKVKKVDTHTLTFSLTPSFNAFSVGLSYYFRPKKQAAIN